VVLENLGESCVVTQDKIQDLLRDSLGGEGLVHGSDNCERSGSVENISESGSDDEIYECGETKL